MSYNNTYFSGENRYWLGADSANSVYFLAIPVSSGNVDYNENYRLSSSQYDKFMRDPAAAAIFADECRRKKHDDLLLQKPDRNRGPPPLERASMAARGDRSEPAMRGLR